jgi:glycolate oxidase FAD binding subunit
MVIEAASAEEIATALRQASELGQSVVIRGAGTKADWGRSPQRVDRTLCTRRLNRILAHEHGDLTATIEAGATLADANASLASAGQWLPLDPPFADRATIGGILATNDSGPLRQRFGTPRDLVIGVQLATTDGVLARAGGRVVKNVAGYDLSKLVAGSFGSLAAIVSATFKLAPLPKSTKTLVARVSDVEAVEQIVREVMSSQLEPIAFEIQSDTVAGLGDAETIVMLRFASVPAAVDAQIDGATRLASLKGSVTTIVQGDDERTRWREQSERIWSAPGAVVRASWLPANLASAMRELQQIVGSRSDLIDDGASMIGRAGVGAGLIRINGGANDQAAVIEHLRRASVFGNVVIVRGSAELKAMIDVWGPQRDRERLFKSLKQTLDPKGVLNAGRGPL